MRGRSIAGGAARWRLEHSFRCTSRSTSTRGQIYEPRVIGSKAEHERSDVCQSRCIPAASHARATHAGRYAVPPTRA